MGVTTELIPRILRDMNDGVLALDQSGRIIYMNPQSRKLFQLTEESIGKTYAEVFFGEHQGKENDAFHQMVLDAIYRKEEAHHGTAVFIDQQKQKRYFSITSSFLKNDHTEDSCGVVMVMSDVTETEVLKKKRYDASIVFSCVTACVCLYLLLLATLEFLKINVPTKALTQVINGMVCVIGFIIYKKTEFSFDELGLKIKNGKETLGIAFAISASVIALLAAVKLILLKSNSGFFAEGTPFWNWNIGLYSWISYLFTSVLQEFLARSMIYGSIRKMFDGKNATMASIVLSSLLFGAVHIAHGFMYMAAAMILLGALGGLYEKQRNIWGVAIIHYVLGQAACSLGFLA